MSESADSSPYQRTSEVLQEVPRGDDFEEMTVPELRARVAVEVGARTRPTTPLDLETMNSVYAYLTGEFYIPPKKIGTEESKGSAHTRFAIAVEAGCYEEMPYPRYDSRPLRRDELVQLLETMTDQGDQRLWAA